MDKVTLNNAQIKQLVDFIKSRGFKEPHVIVEILDHFACKVEEILKDHPSISFDNAMDAAHRKFGISGFYPLISTYYEAQRKKYSAMLWKEIRGIVTSPIYLAAFVVIYALCYKGGILFNQYFHSDWININTLYFVFYMLILSNFSFRFVKRMKYIKDNFVQAIPAWFMAMPIANIFLLTFQDKYSFSLITCHIYCFLIVSAIIRQICYNRVLETAQNEIHSANEYYNGIVNTAD